MDQNKKNHIDAVCGFWDFSGGKRFSLCLLYTIRIMATVATVAATTIITTAMTIPKKKSFDDI